MSTTTILGSPALIVLTTSPSFSASKWSLTGKQLGVFFWLYVN